MQSEIQSEPASRTPKLGDQRILVQGLTKRFGEKVALHPTELEIGRADSGSITGLLGPNGSGKSTLMRIMTGLLRPDAGEAFVDGQQLRGDGTAIRKRCCYSPGELSLYDEMRGREHLKWLLRGRGKAALTRGLEIANSFELPLDNVVRSFSHGMKRQLLFAATMAPKLAVRILDEPTEGLDPSRRADVLELMQADAANGTTILLSSHHLGEVALACDDIIFLNQGRVLAVEKASSLVSRGARPLTLTYADTNECALVAKQLATAEQLEVSVEGATLTARLEFSDPRVLLARLGNEADWPIPRAIAYGDISLAELYRSLYGVEGV